MKKPIFYISIVATICLLIQILQIVLTDFKRLTEYGYGYVTGKVILIILFSILILFTKSRNTNPGPH
jgi:hypothetical protein